MSLHRSSETDGTVIGILERRAREHPDRLAFTFLADGERPEAEWTYGELARRTRAVAAELGARGLRGQRVLLLFPPGLNFVAAFLGCLASGAVAVPVQPPSSRRTLPRLLGIAGDAQPTAVLTVGSGLGRARRWLEGESGLGSRLAWIPVDALDPASGRGWEAAPEEPSTVAFLQYTSGSTGDPKGVMVTHRNLLANEEAIRRAFSQGEESVVVGWLPVYHDMGLIGNVLQPVYSGGRCILMSPVAFLRRPARWLEAITRHRADTSGGPDFAYDLCVRKVSPEERTGLDLASWTVAFNGAEPVRADTLERFAETFAEAGFRARASRPCYGLAEATLLVAGTPASETPAVLELDASALEQGDAEAAGEGRDRRLVACGLPAHGVEVAVVDPETGTALEPGRVGEIWVSGEGVAAGYWGRPEASRETFDARLAASPDRAYLRTGDTGFLDGGHLVVTGRLKDLVIVRGRNHHPHDLERTAEGSHPALRPGAGAAFSVAGDRGESLVVVGEIERHAPAREHPEEVAEAIRRAVSKGHEVQVAEVVLVEPGQVPRTSSGKIRRHECRRAYLAEELAVVSRSSAGAAAEVAARAPSPPSDAALAAAGPEAQRELLAGYLREVAAWVLGRDPAELDASKPLAAHGLDSLTAGQLQGEVETGLGVAPSVSEILEAPDLGELARRLASHVADGEAPEAPPPAPSEPAREPRAYPLSPVQKAFWFLHQLAPEDAAYNVALAARSSSPVEPQALASALDALVRRHGALRTVFHARSGDPVQEVQAATGAAFETVDADDWSEARVRSRLLAEAYRPFDLETGPLFRVRLLRGAPDGDVLLLVAHHIVVDGWSVWLLLDELRRLYSAPEEGERLLPPPGAPYSRFVRWQEELLESAEGERLWSYWRRRLDGELPTLELPTDRPRPPARSLRGGSRELVLDPALTRRLRALAAERGSTFYTAVLAAFTALLHRYSSQRDLLLSSPVSGRTRAELEGTVGCFFNALPLRIAVGDEAPFAELLERVRAAVLEALDHQDYPSHLLAERLQPERDPGRLPLFQQVMFIFQQPRGLPVSTPRRDEPGMTVDMGPFELTFFPLPRRFARAELELEVLDTGDGCALGLHYDLDLFDPSTVARMAGHLETLLRAVAAGAGSPVAALPLMSAPERWQVLGEQDEGAPEPPPAGTVGAWVRRSAEERPDAVGVVAGREHLSLGELQRRAELLAGRLARAGAGPGSRVGILLERSPELVVALLAAVRAGAAYVPLDPEYPAERLAFMVEAAAMPVVVTRDRWAGRLAEPASRPRLVRIDDGAGEAGAPPSTAPGPPFPPVPPGAPVYCIFTSGSTGRPKAALLRHGAFAELVWWFVREHGLGPDDRLLVLTSPSFDLTQKDFFAPLVVGGQLHLAPAEPYDPHRIVGLLAGAGVTGLNATPSAFYPLLDAAAGEDDAPLASLRHVWLGGEPVSPSRLARWRAGAPGTTVVNTYGPTECTDVVARHAVAPDAEPPVPIGRPIPGSRLHVVGGALEPMPLGVKGELAIAGTPVGFGYWGRPALTAERFLPHPSTEGPGARIYLTGDLARRRTDGTLELLGRRDHQVKVRGFRVELGEIESVLESRPEVRRAVVGVQGGGEVADRLVAWVEPAPGTAVDEEALLQGLRAALPDYMVPSAFAFLPELPRTATGKVDRRALPEVRAQARRSTGPSPTTPTEEVIAAIAAEVLGVEEVEADEDFFELGCHSLLATRIVARTREAFDVELPVAALFEERTVAGLARRVDALSAGEGGEGLPRFERAPRDGELPLSFAQERLWFLHQLDPDSVSYHVPRALRLVGDVRRSVLEDTFHEIVRRHEILRTTFPTVDGSPVQRIGPPWRISIPRVDLTALKPSDRERERRRLILSQGRRPFHLDRGPFLRLALLSTDADEHYLAITEHHFVHDGWTQGVLVADFLALYTAFHGGLPSPLPELPFQYADFARWQRGWMRGRVLEAQLDYWRERLAGAPELLEFPTDRPRPQVMSTEGALETRQLSGELSDRIRSFARSRGASLFMVLLSAFKVALHRYSGQTDLSVGTGIANRRVREIEGMLGMIINTLVLRTDVSGEPTFDDVVRRVRETCLGAYGHQDLPFEKLVETLQPERHLGHTPLFQVTFSFLDTPMPELRLPGLSEIEIIDAHNRSTKFDFGIIVVPHAEQRTGLEGGPVDRHLDLLLQYRTDLFHASTMNRFLRQLECLLEAALESPERPASSLPLLRSAETHQVLREWNDTATAAQGAWPVHRRFAAQAARVPDAVAVSDGRRHLSYRELAARIRALAADLRTRGVGPDEAVGLLLDRSPEMVVAVLGVLEAGGAFLPVDPNHPAPRIVATLEDAGARLVVTDFTLAGSLPAAAAETVLLGSGPSAGAPGGDAPGTGAEAGTEPEELAYVLFTSGTSGRPKGVAIEHASLANYLDWVERRLLRGGTRSLALTSNLTFDAVMKQLFPPLGRGDVVELVPEEVFADPAAFVRELSRRRVQATSGVPSLWAPVLEAVERDPAGAPPLGDLILGGEAVPEDLVARTVASLPTVTVTNVYGPTEATANATAAELVPGEPVTLGRPVANTRLHLLDGSLRPAPPGSVGEVFLGGVGLARSYRNRPAATAERFVPDPVGAQPGERLYRTGDLARHAPDGRVLFRGRADHQVKLRGLRIELGEVEAALASHPGVAQAVALLHTDGEGPEIVAFVASRDGDAPGVDELRAHAVERLSAGMVPSRFTVVEDFPRTASGKVDRPALAGLDLRKPTDGEPFVAPTGPVETVVAEIWSEVLGHDTVSAHDNFFDLGGHSLLATRVITHLRQLLDTDVPLRSLFEASSLRDFARLVEEELTPGQRDGLRALVAGLEEISEEDAEALLLAGEPPGDLPSDTVAE